jgi:hypothetical protein
MSYKNEESDFYCDEMLGAYLECAVWSSLTIDGIPLDRAEGYEMACTDIEQARKDLNRFCLEAADILNALMYGEHDEYAYDATMVGYDLWLTRNGHGAGFWDVGRYPKPYGDKLDAIAQRMGEYDLDQSSLL